MTLVKARMTRGSEKKKKEYKDQQLKCLQFLGIFPYSPGLFDHHSDSLLPGQQAKSFVLSSSKIPYS